MIYRRRLNIIANLIIKRKTQTFIPKCEGNIIDKYEELNFLDNDIKHNIHKLKCIEQKKIKNDRIIYKKILKDLLKEKENFVADELVQLFYIMIYNDLYYLDICFRFFTYFYNSYIFSKNYFNNVNVNNIIHIIYSYHLFENYHFLTVKNNIFILDNKIEEKQNLKNENNKITNLKFNQLNDSISNAKIENVNDIYSKLDTYVKKNKNEQNNFINMNRYNEYYNNNTYGSFHIYNYYSDFIHFNIDYINKNHLIKILLVLSQFVYNTSINYFFENKFKGEFSNFSSNSNLKNIEKNLFIIIEAFIQKIDIKKDIKKSYTPETMNEKEIKKKKERYINLIDNSYKNFIYIDNELNDHKLVCLFFYVLSNIFHPLSTNFFFSKEDYLSFESLSDYSSNKLTEENKSKISNDSNNFCSSLENLNTNDIMNLPIIKIFINHYNKLEMHNMFYRNIDKEKSNIQNFIIYKNNILKNIKKYVFLDSIYSLDTHYKLIFFKAVYSLNFFNFPLLKYIYLIYYYQQNNNIDNFDYYDNLHFHNFQNIHIHYNQNNDDPTENNQKESIQYKLNQDELNEEIKDKKKYEDLLKNKLIEASKKYDIFNNAYINLLNDIENNIKNNSTEQIINTLLHMHLFRFIDNHFIILIISKLCNNTDKLRNEHKKKINNIIMSLLIFLSTHIYSNNLSFLKYYNHNINIFNHIYYNNNIYIRHLKKLYDFILLLYNKNIFKKKRKELQSWTNYKCI
ncbi:conserved Plasmodium protein, unknown function [Plasmodium gallinaceum]|uniref:Uncharacterized protein n=1 Tax=Plasmodium gallinaceum TaxID=5849 RepID=A0A1J1GRB7_PLAGA|nr:conserved Plasmodium protein, unknown function [Plasmodium gallinaceum]CRG93586.1 conserved Plasmodium protein, unknown function [Plasmodium gallinaceum]